MREQESPVPPTQDIFNKQSSFSLRKAAMCLAKHLLMREQESPVPPHIAVFMLELSLFTNRKTIMNQAYLVLVQAKLKLKREQCFRAWMLQNDYASQNTSAEIMALRMHVFCNAESSCNILALDHNKNTQVLVGLSPTRKTNYIFKQNGFHRIG